MRNVSLYTQVASHCRFLFAVHLHCLCIHTSVSGSKKWKNISPGAASRSRLVFPARDVLAPDVLSPVLTLSLLLWRQVRRCHEAEVYQ